MTPGRLAIADIDLSAVAANTAGMRRLIGSDVRFYGVCKGDAYGIGLERAAPVILEAGADALAVADPADVAALRAAGISAPVLLYPSTPPDIAGAVAALGAIVSLVDMESIAAFSNQATPVTAHAKIDCGFGRLGLTAEEWEPAFAAIRRSPGIRLIGLYTHLGHTDDNAEVDAQMQVFRRAVQAADAASFRNLELMAASSRVMIGYPHLKLNAVNPGRALYGWLEATWGSKFAAMPAVTSIATRVIQIKTLPVGTKPGYLDPAPLARPLRVAVLAAGFVNGLPRLAHGLPVLIRGREAPTVGTRSTEHTVVDVSEIPAAAVGDEAVLLGRQGEAEITAERMAAVSGVPLIELLPRVTRGMSRRYRS